MTLALRSPNLVEALIPVDSAPIDAALHTDFQSYIKGLKKIEEAKLKKQAEAEEMLKDYEEVSLQRGHGGKLAEPPSPLLFGNSFSPTSFVPQMATI